MSIDDQVFGEWWLRPDGCDPATLRAFAADFGDSDMRLLDPGPGSKVSGSDRADAREYLAPFKGFSAGELDSLSNIVLNSLLAVRGRLSDMHGKIAGRWGADIVALPRVTPDLLRALAEKAPGSVRDLLESVEVKLVPSAYPAYVDLAMYPPVPPRVEPRIWISRASVDRAVEDPSVAARVALAVVHEAAGHLVQHRLGVVGNISSGDRLDRELMEGWSILAECLFGRLGTEESLLVGLYQTKRLLPLIASSEPVFWKCALRPAIIRAWPDFFDDPLTLPYRRAIGQHARGCVRVWRKAGGFTAKWQWADRASTPWLPNSHFD